MTDLFHQLTQRFFLGRHRRREPLGEIGHRVAKAEGIVLVAPDASNPQAWRIPEEGPDFFHNLVELVRLTHSVVDERRMYAFGHSAGAIHGLGLGLLESEYFAAVAAHAGTLSREMQPLLTQAPRKIPMAIWVGTDDPLFPVSAVRQTRDARRAQRARVRHEAERSQRPHPQLLRCGGAAQSAGLGLSQSTQARRRPEVSAVPVQQVRADRVASPQRIRPVVLFISVTGMHVASSIVLLLYDFGAEMARFDSGAPASATESVARWAFATQSFPLLSLLERMPAARFPGLWGYVPVVANGAIWGLAAVAVLWLLRMRRASQRRAP